MAKVWAEIRQVLNEVTAATIEPVTLEEAIAYARTGGGADDDQVLLGLIEAARRQVEAHTGRTLINTTYDLTFDRFPSERSIELPRAPLVSVTHIKSRDADDVETTFAATDYKSENTPHGRIYLDDDASWPTDLRTHNAGEIRFVAGYGTARTDVPRGLRNAVLMLVAHWLDVGRSPVIAGAQASTIPMGYESTLWPYRRIALD